MRNKIANCGLSDSGVHLSALINRFEASTTANFSISTEIFSADVVLIHSRSSKDVFHGGHHHRWTGDVIDPLLYVRDESSEHRLVYIPGFPVPWAFGFLDRRHDAN